MSSRSAISLARAVESIGTYTAREARALGLGDFGAGRVREQRFADGDAAKKRAAARRERRALKALINARRRADGVLRARAEIAARMADWRSAQADAEYRAAQRGGAS